VLLDHFERLAKPSRGGTLEAVLSWGNPDGCHSIFTLPCRPGRNCGTASAVLEEIYDPVADIINKRMDANGDARG
jgi:hypothetical protein